MIKVLPNSTSPAEWDEYVENHPEGRFSQLSGYRYLEQVYGYAPYYLTFKSDAGKIVGVLPCFEARSLLFGRRFLSQPFSEYGGFLLDQDLSDDDRDSIVSAVSEYMTDRDLDVLETHGNYGMAGEDERLRIGNRQQLAYLELQRSPESLWEQGVSRHVRKAIRKAERSGLRSIEQTDEHMITTHFYPLYLRSMHRLGSPPHPVTFFLRCFDAMRSKMRIFWALYEDQPIAGLLGFSCGRRVSIVNIVSDERHWHLRPNDLIHWEYIKWACENGYQYFDFGSVRYDGQAQFKEKWGCVFRDSGYYFLTAKPGASYDNFDSSSGSMALASKIWAKCMPHPLAKHVGPTLRKHLLR
jgi:CelD/BcsL family acetyltransferase involved in cellulose biosynthesis